MENIVKNFHQYLIEQKCKDIALFKTKLEGEDCNAIIVSMPNVIENKKLADKIMKDFSLEGFPEGYNKGEWIIFDFGNVVLNCFIPCAREKYNLEKLWQKEKVKGVVEENITQKKTKSKKRNQKDTN